MNLRHMHTTDSLQSMELPDLLAVGVGLTALSLSSEGRHTTLMRANT